jgi:hypothetical protein
MKRIIGLIVVVAVAGALAVAGQARTTTAPSRAGALHVAKVCPASTYQGQPGGYCTITDSNVAAIPAGAKIFYFEALVGSQLETDVALYAGPGNVALGHVTLSLATATGVITFRGGTGDFRSFKAEADVTYDAAHDIWHWDGTYTGGHG